MGGQKGSHDFSPGKAASSAALERALVCLDNGVEDDWNAEAAVASPTMIALFMVTEIGSRMNYYYCKCRNDATPCKQVCKFAGDSSLSQPRPRLDRLSILMLGSLPKTPILSTLIVFGVII